MDAASRYWARLCCSVGLALYAAHPQDECWDFDLPERRMGAMPMKRAMQWVKNNW
jgi:hypothetical protein